MKESVQETPALYSVSVKDRFCIKAVRVWKNPAHARLEIKPIRKSSRYSLERLILEGGYAKSVYRKVGKSGNYSITPLDDLDSLLKELKYFGKKFKGIFAINQQLNEVYLKDYFSDLGYCWKRKII